MGYDDPVSDPSELPQLVTEMVDVSKEYIKGEVITPVRRLGGVSAKSVLAGVLFATGGFLLSIAGLRYAAAAAPASDLWQIGVRAVFASGLLILVAGGSKMVKK